MARRASQYISLEEQEEAHSSSWCSVPVLVPVGNVKKRWDVLVLLLILYSGVAVPIRVCFSVDAQGLWLSLIHI